MATRRKLQKLFALLLVLSMTMGMLNITAFATEGDLICGQEEHAHTAECYVQTLICDQQEGAGHVHTDACYELSCGQEESAGHVHSETCYDAEGNLTCVLEEGEGHTHSDACYTLSCGQEEYEGHAHVDACYEKTLICELPEHNHTDACYAQEPETELEPSQLNDTSSPYTFVKDEDGYILAEKGWVINPLVDLGEPANVKNWGTGTIPNYSALGSNNTSLAEVDRSTYLTVTIMGSVGRTVTINAQRYKVVDAEGNVLRYAAWNEKPEANENYVVEKCEWRLKITDHVYDETQGVVTKEPTCTENGEMTYTCTLCHTKTKTEDIPALHGQLSEGEVCSSCGKVLFTWDEESKTLTFTADIPTYAQDTYITRPYQEYANTAERVVLAEDVQQVGNYAFAYFTALKAVGPVGTPDGTGILDVTSVGMAAFWNVKGITSYTFTEKVQSMAGCLYNCGDLDSVTVHSTTAVDVFGFQANEPLAGSTMVTNMVIDDPDGILGKTNINSTWDGIVNLTVNVKEICGGASSDDLVTLVVTNAESIDDYWMYDSARGRNIFPKLTDITLQNVGLVGEYAFRNTPIQNVTLRNVKAIGEGGFYYCKGLESVTIENVGLIDAYTFDGCDALATLDVPAETKLGYSDIFNKTEFAYLKDRMIAILDGQFALEATPAPETLTVPGGWESSHTGKENVAALNEDQVTKAARWTDEDKTQAEVEFQFNYAKDQGMDFLFVVDYSGSMSKVGNYTDATLPDSSVDNNSRFFDMQSKLLDVADELLNTQGYDNRVAFVTFATNANDYLHTQDFTQDYDIAEDFVMEYQPYGSTNYAIALDAARKLIEGRTDTSREAAVIFISDGQPNKFFDGTSNRPPEYAGESGAWSALVAQINDYADAIKNIQQFGHDTKIFGVLQSIPAGDEVRCTQVLQGVCTEGLFFKASDTQEFSDAINNAIGAAYNVYTLTDTIDPAFTLDENSITASAGTYAVGQDAEGNTTITWTITGVPYVTHTMNYDLTLNQVSGSYPYGSFDTNEGDADVALGTDQVNAVATPVLTRTQPSSGGGTSYNYYTVTVNYLDKESGEKIAQSYVSASIREGLSYDVTAYNAIAIEGYTYDSTTGDPLTGTMNGNKIINVYYTAEESELEDPDVPQGELPDEPGTDLEDPDVPMGELPDEDVPKADAPETGDISGLWLALSALSGTGLAGVTLLGRKKRDEE